MRKWVMILAAAALIAGCAKGGRRELGFEPVLPTVIATPVALFFAGLDRDGDLVTTREELSTGLSRAFGGADSDNDGAISIIAMTGLLEQWLGTRDSVLSSPSFDRDGDNAISRAEFDGEFTNSFNELDGDSDGHLTRAELITVTMRGYRPSRPEDRPPPLQPL